MTLVLMQCVQQLLLKLWQRRLCRQRTGPLCVCFFSLLLPA